MFKAIAKTSKGVILFLGITEDNVSRLRKGDPIFFDLATLKVPEDVFVESVCLFYGRDELEIVNLIGSMIGPDTKVIAVPRSPDSIS